MDTWNVKVVWNVILAMWFSHASTTKISKCFFESFEPWHATTTSNPKWQKCISSWESQAATRGQHRHWNKQSVGALRWILYRQAASAFKSCISAQSYRCWPPAPLRHLAIYVCVPHRKSLFTQAKEVWCSGVSATPFFFFYSGFYEPDEHHMFILII